MLICRVMQHPALLTSRTYSPGLERALQAGGQLGDGAHFSVFCRK